MLPILLALALGARAVSPNDVPAWTSIVAYDEVRVDADTARLVGAGPYTVRLRWSFLDRASAPAAWDAGVRGSVDLVEIDCERGATRTFSSAAYQADGRPVATASFDDPMAAWRTARAGTVGDEVAQQVCGLVRARRGAPSSASSANLLD